MAVTPVELDGVAPNRVCTQGLGRWSIHGQNGGGCGFGLAGFAALLGALVIAGGAWAGFTEPGKAPGAAVPVDPVDFKALALGE